MFLIIGFKVVFPGVFVPFFFWIALFGDSRKYFQNFVDFTDPNLRVFVFQYTFPLVLNFLILNDCEVISGL